MSSSHNDTDTDAVMADVEDIHSTQPSTTESQSKSSNKPSDSAEKKGMADNISTQANSASSHIDESSPLSGISTPSIQQSFLSFLADVGTSAASITTTNARNSESSRLTSPFLLAVDNINSSADLSSEFERPRRRSFLNRDRHIETGNLEELAVTDEDEYIDDEDSHFHHGHHHDDDESEDHEHDYEDEEEQGEEEEEEEEEDDDEDTEEGDDPYQDAHHRMLQSIRNALGMPDIFTGVSDNINGALTAMSNLDDPSDVMTGLQELSEILLMTDEDVLNDRLSISKTLGTIADILTSPLYEDNVEICIMACRCLSNLLDANPSSLDRTSYARVVKTLCRKLFEIQYIDIAELALTSLKKISRRQTHSILENGGLTACLSYLDFFSLPTQRIATETVANTLKKIPRQYFDAVKDAIPLIEGILNNTDTEIMINVSKCICGMIENFSYSTELVEQLATPTILKQLFSYLDVSSNTSVQVKPYIISAISLIIKVSTKTCLFALNNRFAEKIYEILTKHSVSFDDDTSSDVPMGEKNTTAIIQSLIYVDKDILSSSLDVLVNLFPKLYVKQGEIGSPYKCNRYNDSDLAISKERTKALLEVENIVPISKRVMSLLIDVYSCTVSVKIRQSVLEALLEVVSMLTSDKLRLAVKNLDLSLLLSSILTQGDELSLVYGALEISEIILKKLPDLYLVLFFRGGIIDEIKSFASNDKYSQAKKDLLDRLNSSSHETKVDQETDEKQDEEKKEDAKPDDEEEEKEETQHNDDEGHQGSSSGFENLNSFAMDDESEAEEEDEDVDIDENDVEEEDPEPSGFTHFVDQYPSCVFFHTKLEPYVYDKSCAIAEFYDKEMKSRNLEQEMKKEMNNLKAIGEQLKLGQDLLINFEKLAQVIGNVSEFELLCSKVLQSLLIALTTGTSDQIANAKKQFLLAFMKNANTRAFETLVERLNDALNRFEQFEVLNTFSNDIYGSILPSIDRQLRIALTPKIDNPDSKSKKHKSIMISIQAIASFKAIDEFYKTKVRSEHGIFGSGFKLFSRLLESTNPTATATATPTGSGLQSRADSVEGSQSQSQLDVDVEMPEIPSMLEERNDDSMLPNFENDESTTINPTGSEDAGSHTDSSDSSPNPEISDAENATESSALPTSTSSSSSWHLEFYIDDVLISHETSVFGAVYQSLMQKEKQKAIEKAQADNLPVPKSFSPRLPMSSIWSTPHKIYFKKVYGERKSDKTPLIKESPIDSEFQVPESFATSESVAISVKLLQILFDLNSNLALFSDESQPTSKVSTSKFTNAKLTAKLNKQLEDTLIVVSDIMPAWFVDGCRSFPFLFPFESRHQFLQSTSFGYLRVIHKLQQESNGSDGSGSRTQARLVRQKIRIKRAHMLQSAIKVMNYYGASPCVIEVEFFEDVGTGLGPTLEFYATVSKQFTRKKIALWRDDNGDSSSSFVFSANGLFPKPYSDENLKSSSGKKVLATFKALGIFVARAMLDSRILDLNFNPSFFKLVKFAKEPENIPVPTVSDTKFVDLHLYKSLKFLKRFVEAKKQIIKDSGSESTSTFDNIRVDNTAIGDLALDFTYPGDSSLKMIPNGENIDVDINNVDEYIEKVLDFTLGSGIAQQLEAFYNGFSKVFSYEAMKCFSPEELVVMCGQGEADWSYETLISAAQANHGYSLDSRVVQDLFQVMGEFNAEERKAFLQFVTGSPNLPIGGFKALKPPFTIVCREPDAPLTPDECLPTVMTCVNYFKLPKYSSKEILKERILKAIKEGSGSFLLS